MIAAMPPIRAEPTRGLMRFKRIRIWMMSCAIATFAMQQVAQLLLMCDRHDVGISLDSVNGDEKIFLYDNYPGGIGFSEPLFRLHGELLASTHDLIAQCPCAQGCPGCVGPIGDTGPLAKAAALRILERLPSVSAGESADVAEAQAL